MSPEAKYAVARVDGAWRVGVNGAWHGPYSTLDAACAAARKAADGAEAMGYDAVLEIGAGEEEDA